MYKLRKEAHIFFVHLAHSLLSNSDSWSVVDGGLSNNSITVLITPRRFRVFDSIHVQVGGADVWLTWLQRVRLRHYVRRVMIAKATAAIKLATMQKPNV
jgi:hypothetical protein